MYPYTDELFLIVKPFLEGLDAAQTSTGAAGTSTQVVGSSATEEQLFEPFLIPEKDLPFLEGEGGFGGMPDLPIFNVHNIMHEIMSGGTTGGEEAQPLVISSSPAASVSDLLEMAQLYLRRHPKLLPPRRNGVPKTEVRSYTTQKEACSGSRCLVE